MSSKAQRDTLRSLIPKNYEVLGMEKTEIDMFVSHGQPFNFPVSNLTEYSYLPFGAPYEVLQTPILRFHAPVRILTVILSSACEVDQRNYVRSKIRGNLAKYGVYSVFTLGYDPLCDELVRDENEKHGDILQFSHVNSYRNISLSVLYSLLYLHNHHIAADYVLKTDVDCVINYPLLLKHLEPYNPFVDRVYMGDCHVGEHYITNNPRRKIYIPESLVLDPKIAPYASGGGYVISYKLLGELMIAMRHVKFLTHHEDVNIGKGMELLFVQCIQKKPMWVARKGCDSEESCKEYVVMHPERHISEINEFYSYIAWNCLFWKTFQINYGLSIYSNIMT